MGETVFSIEEWQAAMLRAETAADKARAMKHLIAAAEERGRRSGFSEGTDAAAKFIETSPDAVHPAVRGWLARDLRALAPRDSARMDAPSGPRCWCGKPSRHQSGWCGGLACQGGAPRDSGKVEVCRAEVASRMPDYSHYECTLPKGHSGAHREGGAEWTDKDTVIA